MAERKIEIVPSILAADWTRIGEQVREAEAGGADAITLDIMDGAFVPPITFGAQMLEAVRRVTDLPIETHLMIERPENQIDDLARGGANCITIHIETTSHPHRALQQIRERGCEAGITLNPGTPIAELDPVLTECDRVQVMGVNPGWGGQRFIPRTLERIREARRRLDELDCEGTLIAVDGGVNAGNIAEIVRAGGTWLVAGSAVFNERESVAEAIRRLRAAADPPAAGSGSPPA